MGGWEGRVGEGEMWVGGMEKVWVELQRGVGGVGRNVWVGVE